jgi:hypothetical protein
LPVLTTVEFIQEILEGSVVGATMGKQDAFEVESVEKSITIFVEDLEAVDYFVKEGLLVETSD